jgi:hypothetical protein
MNAVAVRIAATALFVLGSGVAAAGEQLQLSDLIARSDGAAVVRVSLGRGKQPTTVTLLRVVRDPGATLVPDASWIGGCLPDRKQLQRWLHRHPRWAERKLWQRAARLSAYEALVFIKRRDGRVYPYCEVEGSFLKHTDVHADYPAYLKQATAALQNKTASPKVQP